MFSPNAATPVLLFALWAAVSALAEEPSRDGQSSESDLQIVAAAVRVTGARCNDPRAVEREADESRPDRQAWIIRCEGGRFRVTFEGDTGPRVTPLD